MKWIRVVPAGIAALAVGALFFLSGCTDQSSRTVLTVVSLNEGNTYYADIINEADSQHVYVPVDQVKFTLGNIPNDGGAPLAAGSPFSEIVVTGYNVTWQNGTFSPITGGISLRIPSGGTVDGSITLDSPSEKAAYYGTLNTITDVATVTFFGYNRINGSNNGDQVSGFGRLTVQVDNFGDNDVTQ